MIAYYPQIKAVHVHAIGVSFAIFFLRGLLMLMRSKFTNHAALRYASYTVDTVLLTAALMLATMLHQYPFVHVWLTAKVVLPATTPSTAPPTTAAAAIAMRRPPMRSAAASASRPMPASAPRTMCRTTAATISTAAA